MNTVTTYIVYLLAPEEQVESHGDAAGGDVGTQSLSHPRTLPECASQPVRTRERGGGVRGVGRKRGREKEEGGTEKEMVAHNKPLYNDKRFVCTATSKVP